MNSVFKDNETFLKVNFTLEAFRIYHCDLELVVSYSTIYMRVWFVNNIQLYEDVLLIISLISLND